MTCLECESNPNFKNLTVISVVFYCFCQVRLRIGVLLHVVHSAENLSKDYPPKNVGFHSGMVFPCQRVYSPVAASHWMLKPHN